MLKKIRYGFEGAGFWLICRLFLSLSPRRASDLGGWLARLCGPYFPLHKVACRNISVIFPRLSYEERQVILKKMWEQWGRVSAEYCHLPALLKKEDLIEIENADILEKFCAQGQPALLFSGHLGNFQMITLAAQRCGVSLVQFYRHANNPFVDKGMRRFQEQAAKRVLTKGEHGTMGMLRALKEGEKIFVLVDQKFHGGIAVPFLGKLAYTSPAIAKLAQRFDCPLIPVRCKRTDTGFKITFYPPLPQDMSEEEVMKEVNRLIGEWILDAPEQWLWIHKRWPFSV